MTSLENRILFVLASINFTHIVDFMVMMPLGPRFINEFNISSGQFSFAVSAYAIMAGLSSFGAAFYADRQDRKRMLLIAYAGFLLGTLACALAPNFVLLVVARMLAGLFGGVISAQVLAIVGDVIPYERRGRAMGRLMLAFSLASVVGVPGGLWLASTFDWHAAFLAVFFVGLPVLLLGIMWVPPVVAHLSDTSRREHPDKMLKRVVYNDNQRVALISSFVMIMGHFSIIPFIAPYMVLNMGFPQERLYLIYLIGGLLTIITAPIVGRLADQFGKYRLFLIMGFFSLIPTYLLTHMPSLPTGFILAITGLFFIGTNGRMVPFQALISSTAIPHQRGSFLSVNSSMQQLATAIAANIGGLIVADGPNKELLHYGLVGWLAIGSVSISLFLAKRIKPVS